tara:strand:+ start:57 stop:611 length:555 start_codon:yes stop_codon:yes gene_type:complete
MATKTKEKKSKMKDKLKEALKSKVKDELVEVKEQQQKEIREKNSKLKEFDIYTKVGCPYCKQLIDKLNDDGIKFVEKIGTEHPEKWAEVASLTGVPVFPTIVIGKNYLTPRRDFQNIQQAVGAIQVLANPKYVDPEFEVRMVEMLKTLGYGFNNQLQSMQQQITPLKSFIEKLQKELEEEDKSE